MGKRDTGESVRAIADDDLVTRRLEDRERSVERSVDAVYMLRTTQQHHVQLSQMADQKASALIAACFVTLSVTVAYAADRSITPAGVVIMLFAVLSAGLAVLAVMPRHQPRAGRHEPNLLFFGDFVELSFDDFHRRLHPVLHDTELVHEAMLRDIHALGTSLMHGKYRYLGYAYRAFLVGLVAATITFAIDLGLG